MKAASCYAKAALAFLTASILTGARPATGQVLCASCPNASFGPASRAYINRFATTLALGDFNEDGSPDAVTGSYDQEGDTWLIAFLAGDGNGQFAAPVFSPLGDHPYSVTPGDFNGDGHLDILVEAPSFFKIFLGNGDGTFQVPDPAKTVPVEGVVTPVVADFNRDGIPDIAISYPSLQVFLGNGDGSFADPEIVDSDDSFGGLTAGDATGAGLSDILVEENGGISLFRSNGDGTFVEGGLVVAHLFQPVVADFNHDGIPDIAGTTTVQVGDFGSSNAVGVALGLGNGRFSAVSTHIVDESAHSLVAADVDGDGSTDLLALTELSHLNVFRNLGNGSFSTATVYPGIFKGSTFAVAELNGDGRPDFIASIGGPLLVSLGGADGSFTFPPATGGVAPFVSFLASTGDFRANGILDVVAFTPGDYFSNDTGSISVLLGDGAGHLGPPLSFVAGKNPIAVGAGDFDGGGADDLVVANNSSPDALVLLSNRDGTFTQTSAISGMQGPFLTADFNNDGHIDVLGNGGIHGGAVVALGQGNGTFLPAFEVTVPMANLILGSGPGYVVGDFNHDGTPDVASATNGSSLSVCLGVGDGSFSAPTSYGATYDAPALAVGDFDNDGNLDLVLGGNLYVGQGNGSFVDDGVIPGVADVVDSTGTCCSFSEAIATTDVNQDGISDLVLSFPGFVDAVFLVSNGDGTFAGPSGFMGRSSSGLLVGDFTGDSLPDIFLGNSVLINTNCQERRLAIQQQPSSCDAAGTPFSNAPRIAVTDDGQNVLDCAADAITASIEPGTGTAGAQLNGTTSITPAEGIATFGDISLNEPGNGFRLIFQAGPLGPVGTRSFTQSLAFSIPPSAFTCSNASTEFSAPTGMDSYAWSLDGTPVSRASEVVFPDGLPSGEHQISLLISKDGCTASSDTAVTVSDPPDAPTVSAPAFATVGATGLTASATPSDGNYLWLIRRNGVLSGGGSSNTTTFAAGAAGTNVILTAMLLQGSCSTSTIAIVPVDFADAGSENVFHDQIDALEKFGITVGCGNGNFCPDDSLTRGQMAAFIAHAHDGSDASIPDSGEFNFSQYDCDAGGSSYFADVDPTDLFCKHIHRIAALGITVGCDLTPDFCPNDVVTRGTMAIFMARVLAGSDAAVPAAYGPDGVTGRSYDCGSGPTPFSDVAPGSFFCRHVGYVWAKGIVDGYPDGTFRPFDLVTRGQTAKFIANTFGLTLGP